MLRETTYKIWTLVPMMLHTLTDDAACIDEGNKNQDLAPGDGSFPERDLEYQDGPFPRCHGAKPARRILDSEEEFGQWCWVATVIIIFFCKFAESECFQCACDCFNEPNNAL